ncbi:MAG: hypothetical protein IMZ46_10295 [Acidobacteria bacterium]|nr:hypothetical protein [Acidobacteriota bacterium]
MSMLMRPAVIYPLFGILLTLATSPIWRLWLLGFNPTLDEVLQISCFGGRIS